MDTPRALRLDPHRIAKRILVVALVAQGVLLLGDLVFNYWDIAGNVSVRRIFNVAREQSLPTWFASLQAFALAVTAWLLRRATGHKGWLWVGAFFLYISIDDAATVHERLGSAADDALSGVALLENWPSFSWQIVVAPFLATGLLASVVYIWTRRPTTSTRLLVVGALAAFAVSQGIDFLEGVDDLFDGWAEEFGVAEYTVGHGLRSIEEALEMLGTLAIWAPMLWLLADTVTGLKVEIGDDSP